MRTVKLLLGGLLLSAVLTTSAMAASVRVQLTARVSQVSDPSNVLGGKVVLGGRVNGLYVYNPNTPPDPSPFPGVPSGSYHPYANEARLRFASGGLVFENVQPTQSIGIILNRQSDFGTGQFWMFSTENKLLANGAAVTEIWMEFQGRGNITESSELPTQAPVLTSYFQKQVRIAGNLNGAAYSFLANIEAATLLETESFAISPAAGTFVPNQHFDAALTLPKNSMVASVQASANGMSLPLTYPGSCLPQGLNSASKPVIVCAGADVSLPIAAGAPIDWTVTLTNGTVLSESVTWELAQ